MLDHDADAAQVQSACMSSDDQWPELESAMGCFTGAIVDNHRPCSVTSREPCHILRQLPAWNELIFPANMQLRELPGAHGKLALVNIFDDPTFYVDQPQVLPKRRRDISPAKTPQMH
ncbi:hypothetical protein MRX96_044655 [Rhipicephalus microplus]